ncbi:MAG: hypothetical protein ACXVVK_19385 [Solirubrobacteraceae bacterium]
MTMPSREWTGAGTVIVVALVLAALDILDGSVHRWWTAHAFTTSLVGGLLVLLVTVLIADRVIHARQLRDRSLAIAAQAAIVMTQAARTAQAAIAILEGGGDRDAVGDELRSYGTMLLIAAPLLIDATMSRTFLEQAQRLAAELARALHAQRRGTAGEAERARLDDAVARMRAASAPLLAILSAAQREAVTDESATSPTDNDIA